MQVALTIIVIVVIILILMLIQKRKVASSWTGTVTAIDKRTIRKSKHKHDHEMVIKYRTDMNKNGKFSIVESAFAQYFPNLQIGDRLVKVSGEYLPKPASSN